MLKHLLIITTMAFSPFLQVSDQKNPYHLMNDVATKVFTRLKKEQKKIHQNPNYLRKVVREELLPYVQVKYAGALVLRLYYREATSAQRIAYFNAFQDYLEKAYAQALALYNNQIYKISAEKPLVNNKIISVRVTITDHYSRSPIHLDFQWRKNSLSGKWQAYDMSAEGISMITTKQNEWALTLRKKGIEGLTKQLKESSSIPINLDKLNYA